MLHKSKHIWIAVARKEVHIHFSRKFLPPEIYGTILFWGVKWQQQSCKLSAKRFLLSELLKFWDKKHTSSLVWYVVCMENLYFSICRCVCSNLWDFQFLVSSSFLFPRFLVAVIDKILLICFDTWPFTQPNFFNTEPSLAVFLNWHFYVAVTLLLFIPGSSSLWSESILFCIFLLLSYYIRSDYFSCHTCIVYHICSPLSVVQFFFSVSYALYGGTWTPFNVIVST